MPTTTISGLNHYYDDVGSGEEVLVMVHGATGSAHAFEPQYPGLSTRFRVIAPDLRSMGRSEHVTEMPPTAWVDDLGELLDQLGADSVHVLGNSLGSRIAMRFAINNPQRVRSVTVVNPIIAITPRGHGAPERLGRRRQQAAASTAAGDGATARRRLDGRGLELLQHPQQAGVAGVLQPVGVGAADRRAHAHRSHRQHGGPHAPDPAYLRVARQGTPTLTWR